MKETSVFDVALMLFFGAAVATSVVVGDWWNHLTLPAPSSATQHELVADQSAYR